ncbi:MAG TPA: glycosyltransferase family 4 protein [Candidatus Omnitrophota bacterium]|nr:glycosyltransferase family 4 protein [Candidatus Omnitrophota bacterium]HPD85188.1 glycosyltransferase family 4 protein [Candidatus Omnitrophota bacterium]HRZ04311.1 glycosyltransferase family 4 protein [Candidatus Omnitrophota bacterium]
MRIFFITKELPFPPDNGHRVRTLHILKGLARTHKVTLVCQSETPSSQLSAVSSQLLASGLEQVCESIEIVPVPLKQEGLGRLAAGFLSLFSPLPYSIRSRYCPLMKQKMKELLNKENFDAILCDGIHQAINIPETNIRMILNEHNIESTIIGRYAGIERQILRKIFALIECSKMKSYERRTWQRFNQVLVCSNEDKQGVVAKTLNVKVDVVPNGVDTKYFCLNNAQPEPNRLIYTGLMSWFPNRDAVLYFVKEIYPLIKKEIPNVSFWIVGKGPTDEIKALPESDTSIHVTGFVDDVQPLVWQSICFVVPLRVGSGTRLKILEAMAMGKTVVSTRIGAEGIEAVPEKHILLADAPQIFADQVIRLLKDENLRRSIEKESRRFIEEKYSWDKICEDLRIILLA